MVFKISRYHHIEGSTALPAVYGQPQVHYTEGKVAQIEEDAAVVQSCLVSSMQAWGLQNIPQELKDLSLRPGKMLTRAKRFQRMMINEEFSVEGYGRAIMIKMEGVRRETGIDVHWKALDAQMTVTAQTEVRHKTVKKKRLFGIKIDKKTRWSTSRQARGLTGPEIDQMKQTLMSAIESQSNRLE